MTASRNHRTFVLMPLAVLLTLILGCATDSDLVSPESRLECAEQYLKKSLDDGSDNTERPMLQNRRRQLEYGLTLCRQLRSDNRAFLACPLIAYFDEDFFSIQVVSLSPNNIVGVTIQFDDQKISFNCSDDSKKAIDYSASKCAVFEITALAAPAGTISDDKGTNVISVSSDVLDHITASVRRGTCFAFLTGHPDKCLVIDLREANGLD